MFLTQRKHTYGPPRPVTWIDFISLYVDYVRTSQETRLWASPAFYGNSFISLYVDDLRTSQERHLWASTASYGDNCTYVYIYYIHILRETQL
jgi:hypothetical protein